MLLYHNCVPGYNAQTFADLRNFKFRNWSYTIFKKAQHLNYNIFEMCTQIILEGQKRMAKKWRKNIVGL